MFKGIWDCLSSQEAVDLVRRQISVGYTLPAVVDFIPHSCMLPEWSPRMPGTDNMTIVIVAFLHGQTKEEWTDAVTRSYVARHGTPTPSPLSLYPWVSEEETARILKPMIFPDNLSFQSQVYDIIVEEL
jgi:hypothetical protein